jgi:hypothetical protein
MRDAFAREWLVEDAAGVSVRDERLERLARQQPDWTYYSPRFERSVLRHLAKRWPLEYRAGHEDA